MVSYGTNTETQTLAFGAVNTSLDDKTQTARDSATSIINSFLNLDKDIIDPSDAINRCCNLLASGILQAKPGESAPSQHWDMGIRLLEQLRGDDVGDAPWGLTIPVERFHSFTSLAELRPFNFVE